MEQKMLRLRKRPEFLAVQKGEKRRGALFLLEVRARPQAAAAALKTAESAAEAPANPNSEHISKAEAAKLPRLGLTVTRKNGNAVRRNRIKRRLREAARIGGLAAYAEEATDYVVVARPDILTAPFPRLIAELRRRFAARPAAGEAAGRRGKAGKKAPPRVPG